MPDSYGYRNHKIFAGDGASNDAGDLTYLSERIADLGTRRVGTTDERSALPAVEKFEGLLWSDTTDGNEYRYTSGGWAILSMSKPASKGGVLYAANSNPNTGSSGYSTVDYSVSGGWCRVTYSVYLGTGASLGSGSWGLILPVAASPTRPWFVLTGQYIRAGDATDNFGLRAICDGSNTSRLNILTNDGGVRIGSGTARLGPGDRLLVEGGYPVVTPVAV